MLLASNSLSNYQKTVLRWQQTEEVGKQKQRKLQTSASPTGTWMRCRKRLFNLFAWVEKGKLHIQILHVPCHNFSPKKEKSNLRQRAAAVKLINLWCFLWSFSSFSSTAWIFSRKYKLFEGPFLICFELFICKAVKIWVIKRSEKWSRMRNWWLPWCCCCCLVLS